MKIEIKAAVEHEWYQLIEEFYYKMDEGKKGYWATVCQKKKKLICLLLELKEIAKSRDKVSSIRDEYSNMLKIFLLILCLF